MELLTIMSLQWILKLVLQCSAKATLVLSPTAFTGIKVALKQIDCNNEDLADVWKEVVIHRFFGANHDNILRFIGYSISKNHKFFIFTQLMENGSLLNLLQTTGPQYIVRQKFLMTIQIANGMNFLESIRIIHRDLAVQNIFISFQNGSLRLKIVDFGLSRQDNYKLRANSKISLEWAAPEVINHRKYTHKSNVWSFEVTFWEILRDDQHPPLKFHKHQFTSDNVETFRKEMISFRNLTKKTYLFVEFFENIWVEDPDNRASFKKLYELLFAFMLAQNSNKDGLDISLLTFAPKIEPEIKEYPFKVNLDSGGGNSSDGDDSSGSGSDEPEANGF